MVDDLLSIHNIGGNVSLLTVSRSPKNQRTDPLLAKGYGECWAELFCYRVWDMHFVDAGVEC